MVLLQKNGIFAKRKNNTYTDETNHNIHVFPVVADGELFQ